MNVPMGPLLAYLGAQLQGLIEGTAWRRIESLAAGLPWLGGRGAFEVHLGDGAGRVDLGLAADNVSGKRLLARALAREGALPAAAAVAPVLEEWVRPGTPLSEQAHILWLEYDLVDETVAPPMIHLGLIDAMPTGAGDLMAHCRRLTSGPPLAPGQLAALELCCGVLPRAGVISFVTDLYPARPVQDLRVVAELPREDVFAWLEAVGWPGRREACGEVLELIAGASRNPSVFLDVGESVRPNLGVELLPDPLEATQAWHGVLRRLVELDVASPGQMDAVLRWGGGMTVELPGVEPLIRIERCAGVKLVLDAAGRLSAKSYFSFSARSALF